MGAWEDGFRAGWGAAIREAEDLGRPTHSPRSSLVRRPRTRVTPSKPKVTRTPTAYNRFMKTKMRSLRRKHPRMKQPQIMKKAAKAWRAKKRGKK